MPREPLGDFRMHARPRQVRNECVSQRMEVENAARLVAVVKETAVLASLTLVRIGRDFLDPVITALLRSAPISLEIW